MSLFNIHNGAMIRCPLPGQLIPGGEGGPILPLVDGGNIMHLFVDDVFPLV
jgi:hypothetical protein